MSAQTHEGLSWSTSKTNSNPVTSQVGYALELENKNPKWIPWRDTIFKSNNNNNKKQYDIIPITTIIIIEMMMITMVRRRRIPIIVQ